MSWSRQPCGRWLALALLAGLMFGPAGMGAVFHPADDAACASLEAAQRQDSAGPVLTAAAAVNPHCQACHLLRSARWAGSGTPAPSLLPEATVAFFHLDPVPVADGTHLTTPGRSPPMMSRLPG